MTRHFALDLLEQKHVLVAPGVSFNVPYRNHFRVTNLPDAATLRDVFARIEELLARRMPARRASRPVPPWSRLADASSNRLERPANILF